MRDSKDLAMHPALAGRVPAIDVIDHAESAKRVLPADRACTYRNVGAAGCS